MSFPSGTVTFSSTVTVQDLEVPLLVVAVIVVLPSLTPVTTPSESTVAIVSSALLQEKVASLFTVALMVPVFPI